MRARKFWKFGLITLGLGVAGAGHAETWHVTSGPNDEEHSTWTISDAKDGGVTGSVDVTDGPTNLYLGGNWSSIRVIGIVPNSGFCEFEVHQRTTDKVSGTEFCFPHHGHDMSWSATIDKGP
jgi:hypothetical protein